MSNRRIVSLTLGLFSCAFLNGWAMGQSVVSHEERTAKVPERFISQDSRRLDQYSEIAVLVSLKGAAPFPANLIGPDSADADAVILEMLGVRRSFKLDDIRIYQQPSKFDEYGDIATNDTKARLDNYAIALRESPDAHGYIIAYGRCIDQGPTRANQAKSYLVSSRGFDAEQLMTVDGGCRRELTVELWVVPAGAAPPEVSSEGVLDACPRCSRSTPRSTPRRTPRRRRGH